MQSAHIMSNSIIASMLLAAQYRKQYSLVKLLPLVGRDLYFSRVE